MQVDESMLEAATEETLMLDQSAPRTRRCGKGAVASAAGCVAAAAAAGALALASRSGGVQPSQRSPAGISLATGCLDTPGAKSGAAWSDGTNFCDAYEGTLDLGAESFCSLYGAMDFNGEGPAKEHCCACGGGKSSLQAVPQATAAPSPLAAAAAGSQATLVKADLDEARSDKASDPDADVQVATKAVRQRPQEPFKCSGEQAPPPESPDPVGTCSVYTKSATNCDGVGGAGVKCGQCFNAGARPGVICPGERTGYQCPPDEPDTPGGMAFACMDWTFGSTAMRAAESAFSCRSGGGPVYFGVGTYGISLEKDKMGGLGMCLRMSIQGVDRDIIAQSINTGHDVAGNQFDLQIGAGGAGAFNTCAGGNSSMFPGPKKSWGHQYGGPDKKAECTKLPPYPRDDGPMRAAGDNLIELCEYGFDKGVFSNPTILSIERVACPAELVNLTQFRRTDGPDAEDGHLVVRKDRRLAKAKNTTHKCNVLPGAGLDWCQTRMMDCRKPSGAVKDNVVDDLVAPGLKLVQPCTADGYTRIDVQCGCYDCYC